MSWLRNLSFPSLMLGLFLAGCAPYGENSLGPEGFISVGSTPEYGAYLLAEERLSRIQPGIDRGEFLRLMQLRRLPSEEWYTTFSGGDGWLIGLSRKNQVGDDLLEEYSFGYHQGQRVVERNLVILRNGKVASILEVPQPEFSPGNREVGLPPALLVEGITRAEENQVIRSYIERTHLTRHAFARAEARLMKVRVGMTAGQLRYYLRGSFYRLRHGYVYFAEGFLWGPKFRSVESAKGSLTLMPFGYVEGGKEVQRIVVKIVDGVIAEITRTEDNPTGKWQEVPRETPSGDS